MEGCLEALRASSVVYECVRHEAAATVEVHTEELRRAVEAKEKAEEPVPAVFRQGGAVAQVKNLVLRDKKRGGLYLVSCDKVRATDTCRGKARRVEETQMVLVYVCMCVSACM